MKKSFTMGRWLFLVLGLLSLSSVLINASIKSTTIKKLEARSTKTDISLCANTSNYFSASDAAAARAYIHITPKHYFGLELSYGDICISGLKAGTQYTISINKNIPLGSVSLDKDYKLTAMTKGYSPSFSFPDAGYILPSGSDITIPLRSTNVDSLKVALYRINTNNLIRSINDYGLLRSLSSYRLDDIANTDGYLLWEKRLQIHSTKNQAKTTAIPVGEHLKDRKSGVYILSAQIVDKSGEVVYDYDDNTQWFMISDIGLYTLRADEGLYVYTKRLSTAKIYDEVKLEIISKNNELLGSAVSHDGVALFKSNILNGKKGLEPKAIYAYGEHGDFSVLDLSKPAHDLSDRGVGGRDNPGHYDAFIYSNRGIYRPGESVQFHTLVRDKSGKAQARANLSAQIYDSRHVKIETMRLTTDELGHASGTIDIASSSSTGRWSIELFAGSTKAIGSISFLVEDFVPPKIKVEIHNQIKELKPKQKAYIKVTAKYLNGEPIPNANVEVSATLLRAKKPFVGYESYYFGDIKEQFYNTNLKTDIYKTDTKGALSIPFAIDYQASSSLPISAHIDISVNELGGRPVHRVIDQFYADKSAYIGIKPNFERDAIDMDAYASFDIAYLRDSKLAKGNLLYKLIKERTTWHWRSDGDDWEYYKIYSDINEIASGEIATSSQEPISLKLPKLNWGSYRLQITDRDGIITTYRFSSGYEQSSSKSSPDRLPVAIDKQSYSVGEKLRVNIKPKFTGPVLVAIAHHSIIQSKTVDMVAGRDTEVEFEVADSWGKSAYVLASAFRAQSPKLGANRAIGLAHIEIHHPEQEIALAIDHPRRVKSSTKVTIKVRASNIGSEPTAVTLAAVDEGILNLTDYQMPDPVEYFLGQQKLGVDIRDIYANLIQATGAHARFDVGSDGDLMRIKSGDRVSSKRKIVALFSDVVKFDAHGVATIELDIPEYQGSVKLMALAWNQKATGASQSDMVVKDSISAEYYMPRFISVGDRVESLLSVDFDTDVPRGKYLLRLTTDGGVTLEPSSFELVVEGTKTSKWVQSVTMLADRYSDSTIHLEIAKDGKRVAHRSWEIAVRSQYPQSYIRQIGLLKPNDTLTATKLIDSRIWSDSHSAHVMISGKPILSIKSIQNELTEYAGRCAEQTTSRAMPWLFAPRSAESDSTIQNAIDRLLTYQKIDGSFGLWSSSKASMWVSAYVMDFLTRAKKAGYTIPELNINQGLNWLENNLNRWASTSSKQEADVYALYVLARSDRVLMSEIKFHALNRASKIKSAQAWGHLGATLAYVGERDLAKLVFDTAIVSTSKGRYYSNYGGNLRDEAALVVLMHESKLGLEWESRFADLCMQTNKQKYLSTQEMSLLLRAAHMSGTTNSVDLKLSTHGKPLPTTNGVYSTKAPTLDTMPAITNQSSGKVWYTVGAKATPVAQYYSSKNNNGFSITKKIYTMSGEEIDLAHIGQNSRLVVALSGTIQNSYIKNPLITDWVIAGFELENPTINGVDATNGMKWLGAQSSTEHKEYRDDRFEAALSMGSDKDSSFNIAYIIRAVSKGRYTMPPAKIEDMYQPQYRAFSPFVKSKVEILESGAVSPKTQSVATLSERDYLDAYHGTIGDVKKYKIVQLNLLRNSIFAHAGLDFQKSNPMLHKRFLPYTWYGMVSTNSSQVYADMSKEQKRSIHMLLDEEKSRCGGELSLSDFYRVRHRALTKADLQRYSVDSLRILFHSLFARHGMIYNKTNPKLAKIYNYMPWYKPRDIKPEHIYRNLMEELERVNADLISNSIK